MSTEGLLIEHSRVFGSDVMTQPSDITDPSGLGFGFRVQGQEFSRPSENPLRPYSSTTGDFKIPQLQLGFLIGWGFNTGYKSSHFKKSVKPQLKIP